MSLKLGSKFIVFLLAGLLPLLRAIGFFFHQQLQGLLLQQIDASLDNNLVFVRNYLEREQFHVQNAATIIANDPTIRKSLDRYNSRGMNSHLNRIIRVYPDLNYLILVDANRTVFAINTIGPDKKKINSEDLLGEKIDQHPLITSRGQTEAEYSAPGLDPYLSIFGLPASQVVQWFIAPVMVRGKSLGWVILSYKWQENTARLQQDLIDLLISHGHPVLSSGIIDQNNQLISGYKTTETNTIERTLPIVIDQTQFTLSIQFDQQAALSALSEQRNLLIKISVPLLIVLLAGIYYLIVKQLLNPIRRLEEGAKRFASGDLEYRLPEQGEDELTQLSRSFNMMGNELSSAKATLELQVAIRTKEITQANKHLGTAIVAAEQASVAKSAFLASMSHEIRTPMNGVLGMLSLLSNSSLSKQQDHYVTVARSSAESLLVLINDIVDFSKIEAGKLTLEVIDFNIADQLSELSEVMAFRAEEKGLELILDMSEINHPMVKGDPSRLRQILTNLVGNAIKFTSSGEIVIKAKLVEETTDGSSSMRFCCSVSDTGIGIPPDKVNSLFDSFTQVDASTTRQFGGTGLGLSIVKQLCELMGGRVSVSSNLDRGSCFNFDVCLQNSDKLLPSLSNLDFRHIPILIVEDNPTHREVLRHYLEQWGANVTEKTESSSVLPLLESQLEQPFKIIIIDADISGVSGEMLGKTIRADSRFDETELIIMTSVSKKEDIQYYTDIGFSAYFCKPISPSDLFDALALIIRGTNENQETELLEDKDDRLKEEGTTPSGETRVLLVDDNIVNREVGLGILEVLGYEADAVDNGIEAINVLSNQENDGLYDVVLMDCQMPEMDGYEATQWIRTGTFEDKQILNTSIPIIAMTANAMKGDKEKCLDAGMNDYIPKPVDPDELLKKLKRWI